jgi:glutathione peroxidase-family protein
MHTAACSNQFGAQEPGSNADIQRFAKEKYGVTFPVFGKVRARTTPLDWAFGRSNGRCNNRGIPPHHHLGVWSAVPSFDQPASSVMHTHHLPFPPIEQTQLEVNGPGTHELFQFLKEETPKEHGLPYDLRWNFGASNICNEKGVDWWFYLST